MGLLARTFARHGRLGSALALVLGVMVLAPGLGFLGILLGGTAGGAGISATQVNAIRETALLLAGVGVFCGVVGVITAWLVSVYDFPLRRILALALVLPLAFPTYLAAYIAVDLLHFFGPIQTLWRWMIGAKSARDYAFFDVRSLSGAVFVLGLVLFPYVYVPCRILFSRSGRNVIDAARMLGVSGPKLFARVGLPIARPALIAGMILALLETLNDIGATEYLGVSSLSVVIRDLWLNRGDLASAGRLAFVLVALVALLMLLDPARRRRDEGRSSPRGRAEPTLIRLSGVRATAAMLLCAAPVLVGFVVPVAFLSSRAVSYSALGRLEATFFHAATTTLALAFVVSLVVMAAGALIAVAIRLLPRFSGANVLTALGYATPGTVLALAMVPVIRSMDDGLAGIGIGAALTGTSVIVVYALSVRFLGLGVAQAEIALARLPTNVDAVARVHGLSDLALALRVHLPVMMPGLLLAGTLVFIDTVKELPATILLRPFNLETLATRAYSLASVGLFEHAALESLMIVAFSAIATRILAQKI